MRSRPTRSLLTARTAACALAFLLGVAAWPAIAPRVLCRDLRLDVTIRGPGPANLRWAGARNNGVWLDPADYADKADAAHGDTMLRVHQRLPSYALDRIEIAPANDQTAVVVGPATLQVRFFRGVLFKKSLEAATLERAVVLPAQPSLARDCWPGALASGLAALGLLVLVGAALWACARLESRLPPGTDRREPRWLLLSCIAVCILAPLLMALWAPMLLLADSSAYLRFSFESLRDGSLDHFDGWRLPGYPLILMPFLRFFTDHASAVGVLHALLGAANALLVLAILRPRLRPPWPHLAAALVAIDPVLLGWQRVLMPETFTAFLILVAAWLFLRAAGEPNERAPRSARSALILGACLGLVAGYACAVRANLQLLPAIVIPALLWQGWRLRRRAPILSAVSCALVAALVVLPLVLSNRHYFNRPRLVVGAGFVRSLFSWDNGTTDWNQSGSLSFEEFSRLREWLRTSRPNDWQVSWFFENTATIPVPAGAAPFVARDIRCAAVTDEAFARRGPEFSDNLGRGAAAMLGLPIDRPHYARASTNGLFAQLKGERSPRTPTNFDYPMEFLEPAMQTVMQRSTRDITWTTSSPIAHAFGPWFDAWWFFRPVMGVALLAAALRLAAARDRAMGALAALVLANIVMVPFLTCSAEVRYAAPFYPLLALVVFYGLFRPPAPPKAPADNL
jgi:hypothetical protein